MSDRQDNHQDMPPPSEEERVDESPAQPAHVEERVDEAPPHPGFAPPYPGPPPVKQKGGFARGFGMGTGLGLGLTVALIALTIVGGILSMISLSVLMASADGDAYTQTEVVWGDSSAEGRLRAVPISGPILTDGSSGSLFALGTYGYEVAEQIDELSTADSAGLVLLVDTPGGTITGARAISDAIERYQERTGQPVLVHVQGMLASGGVYSTAPADEIIADHGTLVGSIGVIYGPFEYYDGVLTAGDVLSGVVQTEGGITREYVMAGTGKDFGNPYRAMTDEERTVYQEGIDVEYDLFVSRVSEHRGIDEATIRDTLGAHLFDSITAESHGLIDETMGRTEFFRHAAEQSGLNPDDFAVDQIAEPAGLGSLLGIERAHGVALPLEARAGRESLVSQNFCDPTTPLVFAGDIKAVCG